jgi:uncharacterized protein YbbK (DUF523 family)
MELDSGFILIGVSACLLGEPVRYDNDHRLSRAAAGLYTGRFRPLPVCPEVETGMTVPREKLGLFDSPDGPRMIGLESGEDWTDKMKLYAYDRVRQPDIAAAGGFILKSRSPSCGLGDATLLDAADRAADTAIGIFADALKAAYPSLPVIDEIRLEDPAGRESFIRQVELYSNQG